MVSQDASTAAVAAIAAAATPMMTLDPAGMAKGAGASKEGCGDLSHSEY
jgi:hypothetical protein